MRNNDMACLLKADLFKLKKHKSVWIGMIVSFAVILLSYCIYWLGLTFVDANANDPLLTLSFLDMGRGILAGYSENGMVPFLVLIITCIFVGKEFSNGTMRILVSRGANRVRLYFSKWLSLACLIAVYSVFTFLICGIFTSFKGYGIDFDAHQFGLLMRCFFLQLLCNLGTMSIVLMLAFLIRSSGGSLGAAIGAYIALSIVLSIIAVTSVATKGMSTEWLNFMPMQQSEIASSLEKLSASDICAVVIMPIVYGALSTVIGLLTFLKRDVK